MMTNAATTPVADAKADGARHLQERLYREIGISAVAAALRCIKQPDPAKAPVVKHDMPAGLRDHLAA